MKGRLFLPCYLEWWGEVDNRAREDKYVLQTITVHTGNRMLVKSKSTVKMERIKHGHGRVKTVLKGVKSSSLPLIFIVVFFLSLYTCM